MSSLSHAGWKSKKRNKTKCKRRDENENNKDCAEVEFIQDPWFHPLHPSVLSSLKQFRDQNPVTVVDYQGLGSYLDMSLMCSSMVKLIQETKYDQDNGSTLNSLRFIERISFKRSENLLASVLQTNDLVFKKIFSFVVWKARHETRKGGDWKYEDEAGDRDIVTRLCERLRRVEEVLRSGMFFYCHYATVKSIENYLSETEDDIKTSDQEKLLKSLQKMSLRN